MINFICNSKFIKAKEIEQCINLLHKKYRELDFSVIVVDSDEETRKYVPGYDGFISFEYSDVITGFSTSDENIIVLQPYKVYENLVGKAVHIMQVVKILQIALLFHEIRHMYQFHHLDKYSKYLGDNKDIDTYQKYVNDKSEKEANKFSYYMTKLFNTKISEILGIHFKWKMNSDRALVLL